MRAKVKITVEENGQEYLLLVTKMNVKGVLVHTSQMLDVDTKLKLDLKLSEHTSVLVRGYVHKISEESATKKGMVIAFIKPSEDVKRKIEKFITDSKEISMDIKPESKSSKDSKKSRWSLKKKETATQKSDSPPKVIQQSKTMVVGNDDMPSLSLSSPDNQGEISYMSIDEESVHSINPGLAGSTRHIQVDRQRASGSKKSKQKKRPFRLSIIYKAFGFVVLVIVLAVSAGPILRFMDKRFGQKISLPTSVVKTPTSSSPSTSTPSVVAPTASAGVLEVIQVEDQGSFLKVSLLGKGNFASNKISKMVESKTIQLTLLDVSETKAQTSTTVNNDPLAKVNSSVKDGTVIVNLVCSSKELPEYEAQVFPNGMDIFIYR